MTLQYSTVLRNAQLDTIETVIGPSARLQIRTGAPPANPAAAASGSLIGEIALPSNWLADAVNGTKSMSGTWQGAATLAGTNTAGHFRILDSAGATCHKQGTIGLTGSGADMELDAVNIAQGQNMTVTQYQIAAGNA